MTGSELLTYVKRQFKRTDKDSELYECMTDTIVDMRLRMVSDDYAIISTTLAADPSAVDGAYMLTLPTDFGHLTVDNVLVRDTASDQDYDPLNKISKSEYDQQYAQVYLSDVGKRNTGVPCDFALYGGKLYIGPAMDSANWEFKINYTTSGLTEVTSSTDPVPFATKYREVMRDGVLARMYKILENFDEASVWQNAYELGIIKITNNDNYNRADRSGIAYGGL
jgi:hypothetical protein